MLIYKIFRSDEWARLRDTGETPGAPIDIADGYVHFSTADQVRETAAKHFAGEENLFLLAAEADLLDKDLKWEVSRNDALFPHLYRQLTLTDVIWAEPLPLIDGRHHFPSHFVDPSRNQFDGFKGLDRDKPIDMLNLVALNRQAHYPKDHPLAEAGLTGAQAYANYGRETASILAGVGGKIIWRGNFEHSLIGPDEEIWDIMFIAQYPNAHSFLAMISDPEYRQAVIHRQAAVRNSRLIRSQGLATTDAFG